ncbi:MAG: anaerobic glycerol-3-phosphate dehydrogenase subunit C [Ardenticatenaceae bacterium]|nr:anaerobic glycerol-3-phosphate dehydrogenase subunit C [Ardenticatenaceae bacterium]
MNDPALRTRPYHSVDATLDSCIKCNICVSYCPVSAVTDLFPGPKYCGPQAQRFRNPIDQPASPDGSVDYCSGCRVCNRVCPTGVRIAEINARARAQIVRDRGLPLRNRLVGRSELLGKLGMLMPPLANLSLHNPLSRWLAEKVMRIDRHAPLPRWAGSTFRGWFEKSHRAGAGGQAWEVGAEPTAGQPARKQVVYFHACSTNYYEPHIGKAAVAILEHLGFDVLVPPQNCCGLPMLSNGEFDAARRYAISNVQKLLPYARRGLPIVGTSTSCTLTLKEEAPELLDLYDDDTQLVARHTYDFFEFLRELYDRGELDLYFHPVNGRLLYHPPCQLRAHRIGTPALEILRLIPGLEIVESRADCCGIAGTYGLKVEKYPIAMAVGRPLFQQAEEVGGNIILCDSETCRWQIEHGTGRLARHPMEVLAQAYGFSRAANYTAAAPAA